MRRELLPESVKIPDVGELLNKGKESEPPRRLSQFRVSHFDFGLFAFSLHFYLAGKR